MKNIKIKLFLLKQQINLMKLQVAFAKEYTKEQSIADLNSLLVMVRNIKEEEK